MHPGRILPLHRIPDEQVEVARDLIHDRRGSAGRGGTAPDDYDPLTMLMELFDGVTSTKATADELAWRAGSLHSLVTSGDLEVDIHATYPLAEAAQAQRDLESGATAGKLLLKV